MADLTIHKVLTNIFASKQPLLALVAHLVRLGRMLACPHLGATALALILPFALDRGCKKVPAPGSTGSKHEGQVPEIRGNLFSTSRAKNQSAMRRRRQLRHAT